MQMDEAIRLDNWFPDYGRLKVRPGFTEYITSAEFTAISVTSDNVDTIFELVSGANRLAGCCTNNKIIEITTGTPVDRTGAATITSDRWQWVQMENGAGAAALALFNGADAPLTITESGGNLSVATLTISGTGLTVANIIGATVYKERLYVWEKDADDFWYSAHQTLGSTMTKFPVGRLTRSGGNIVSMRVWSQDSGTNANDLLVIIMNTGDVVVYSWLDPGAADTIELVGQFRIGRPIADRACIEYGGEVVVVTNQGYELLSQSLPALTNTARGISVKINPEVVRLLVTNGEFFGWQAIHYPKGNMLIVNVPQSASLFHQHIFNTHTGAACRFTGLNGYSWGLFNNEMYFGGTHQVFKFSAGATDDNGTSVSADCSQAWNYLGIPSVRKGIEAAAPVFVSNGDRVGYGVEAGVDFKEAITPTTSAAGELVSTAWGSPWGSSWSGDRQVHEQEWTMLEGQGYAFSIRTKVVNAEQDIEWVATNVAFEMGGEL